MTSFVLKIPQGVGSAGADIIVQRGRKKLGPLSSPPEVKGDKLLAGKYILVKRGWDGITNNRGGAVNTFPDPSTMEVRYLEDYATYKLQEAPLVYSDGPPHPTHLQLAIRVARTDGVKEPEQT